MVYGTVLPTLIFVITWKVSLMIIIYICFNDYHILMTIFNDVFETLQSCFVVICRLYDFKSKLETSVAKYL